MAVLFRRRYGYKGDFIADSSEITGAYIAAGVDPQTNLGNSKMVLEDVKVIQAPDATKVNLDVHKELQVVADPRSKAAKDSVEADIEIGLRVGGDFYTFTGDPDSNVTDAQREAQIQATYQALKATQEQIDSGEYSFESGKVVVVDDSGNPVASDDLSFSLRAALEKLRLNWDAYKGSVTDTNTTVQTIPILNLDLSKFTSGTSRTTILYYIET